MRGNAASDYQEGGYTTSQAPGTQQGMWAQDWRMKKRSLEEQGVILAGKKCGTLITPHKG